MQAVSPDAPTDPKTSSIACVPGASSIEIIPAKSGPPLAEGDLIPFERSRSLAEVIEEIRRQTVPAFNELKQVLSHLNRSSEDVSVVLAALRAEAERLPATHLALQALLEKGARTTDRVGEEASATLAAARRASESAERATDRVGEAVPEVTRRLGRTLESIDAAATEQDRCLEQMQAFHAVGAQQRRGDAPAAFDQHAAHAFAPECVEDARYVQPRG